MANKNLSELSKDASVSNPERHPGLTSLDHERLTSMSDEGGASGAFYDNTVDAKPVGPGGYLTGKSPVRPARFRWTTSLKRHKWGFAVGILVGAVAVAALNRKANSKSLQS